MSPDLIKFFRDVKNMFPDLAELKFVWEIESEYAGVVMGTLRAIPVLPASVEPERAAMMAEAFQEFCEIRFLEAPEEWEMLVRISQGNEAILPMGLRFVYTPHGPLLGFMEPATGTLPTRQH